MIVIYPLAPFQFTEDTLSIFWPAKCDSYKNRYKVKADLYETLVEKYTSLQNTVSDHLLMNDIVLWNAIISLCLNLWKITRTKRVRLPS